MYTPEERFLQKLAEMEKNEFSVEMIKEAMHKVAEEDLEIQYQEYLKGEEAHTKEHAQSRADENTLDRVERSLQEAAQPTIWEVAQRSEIPQRQPSQEEIKR